MGELRKDYILDSWVIISPGRSKRPKEFSEQPVQKEDATCFFCPGNESLTPKELGRKEKNNQWVVRWFENKFPALTPEGLMVPKTDNRFYTFSANWGHHEIVVETPDHSKQLADLSVEDITLLLGVFAERIDDISKRKGVAYVNVFKNHGAAAGTSIVHSHAQIMATSFVPRRVLEKVFASRKFVSCPYCAIIASEKDSERRCFENNEWVAFAPYASRFNYEVWLFPKNHVRMLGELLSYEGLADILKKVVVKLKELGCSYNFCLQYAPTGQDLHFHIEILPRIAVWGGFELGTSAVINSVAPESAAAFYRGEQHG